MSCSEIKARSILEIFNDMDYEEKLDNSNSQEKGDSAKATACDYKIENLNELNQVLKITKETKSFDAAVEAAVKAHNKWKNSSALKRANSLHKLWKHLKEISNSLARLKNEFLTLVDYFDFYSDLAVQTEEYKDWRPYGVVLIALSNYSHFFVLGATVPAALATGCSVIVLVPEKTEIVPLVLEELVATVGLPEGLINVVTDFNGTDIPASKKISKVFFCGSYLSAHKFYTKSLSKSLNFICPNNTTAFLLESCDLDAAVNKIVTETWGNNSFFAVTNTVVQESIYKNFLMKLKYRIEQFMAENVNSLKFQNKITSEKVNKIILEALNCGATVEKCTKYATEWSPTVIVNYQNQDIDEDVPVLKVLLCRTAREGASLINNSRFNLGTSIWSEISSQALEISTMLVCPNIWINCHGVFEAGEPLQPLGCSGSGVLGGSDGILEYMSFRVDDPVDGSKSNEDKNSNVDKFKTLQLAISAHQAFNTWQHIKSRRKYIKEIAHCLEDNKDLSKLSEMISNYAHFGNIINFSERIASQEFLVIRRKVPIGVILLIVNTTSFDIKSLVSLITPALVLGNAVIVVLKEENSIFKFLIKTFSNFLPKNLVSVVVGMKAGIYLASDPSIQAIWLYEESAISFEFLQSIKSCSAKSLKHIWIIPKNLSVSQHLFQRECLWNKVIWLTKVDQFP